MGGVCQPSRKAVDGQVAPSARSAPNGEKLAPVLLPPEHGTRAAVILVPTGSSSMTSGSRTPPSRAAPAAPEAGAAVPRATASSDEGATPDPSAREFRASTYFGQMSQNESVAPLMELIRTNSRRRDFLEKYSAGEGVTSQPPECPFDGGFKDFFVPPVAQNEEERIRTLWAYNVLDSGLDPNFERITKMAQDVFEVPIALVSLVDANRQWFKSVQGLDCFETGRDVSFCGHAILRKDTQPLVIPDATADWRFRNNPLVLGPPNIRFYAGAPLRAKSGVNLGTLCIIDSAPREFPQRDQDRLRDLAAVVVREIELFAAGKHLLFRSHQEESIAAFSREAMALDLADDILDLAATTVRSVLDADFLFLAHRMLHARRQSGAQRARPAQGPVGSLPMRVRTSRAQAPPAGDEEEEEEAEEGEGPREEGGTGRGASRPKLKSGEALLPGPANEERGLSLAPGGLAAFVSAAPDRSVHVANVPREDRFALPVPVKRAGAQSGACAAVYSRLEPGEEPFAYIGAFSCDPKRIFNDEIRLYLCRFAAALEAVLAQWRAKQALRVSEQKVRREKQLADRLLRNTLPETVVAKLISDSSPIADVFEHTSIVFADIVGFTAMSSKMSAPAVVQMLNRIFSRLDDVCTRTGCEKIKTIGDCYMAAAGVPVPRADHAEAAVEFAIAAVAAIQAFNRRFGTDINIRVGVHSGPVVAGVIGSSKFLYDLWGDTVNIASRMESSGIPGRIQVTDATYQHLAGRYDWVCRGDVTVKGKADALRTYLWNARLAGDPREGLPQGDEEADWDADLTIRGELALTAGGSLPASACDSAGSSPLASPMVPRGAGTRRDSGDRFKVKV